MWIVRSYTIRLFRDFLSNLGNLERGEGRSISMIHFLLLQNRQGQTRLSRWYVPVKAEEKGKIESEVHRMITSRPSKFSNFINVRFLSL